MRIIQLSDLHLTGKRGQKAWLSPVWSTFDRTLEQLPELEPFERIVLTGDLANRPNRRAYELLREALDPYRERLRLIPGNHDGRRSLRKVFADRFEPGRTTFVDAVGEWRLLGLDSKRSPFVHGKLGPDQLGWLAAQLAADDAPALVFLHHPPTPVDTWWLDKDCIRDAAALADVLRGRTVRGVFCGHVHQEFAGEFAGLPLFACPSTAYQFRPGSKRPGAVERRDPALRWIELESDGFRTEVLRLAPT